MCGNRRARRCAVNTYRTPVPTYTSNTTPFTHQSKQDTGIINLVTAINHSALTTNNIVQSQHYPLDEKKDISLTPPAYSERPTPNSSSTFSSLSSTPPVPLFEPFTTALLSYRAGGISKRTVKRTARDLMNELYETEVLKREEIKGGRLGCKERKGIWKGIKEFKREVRDLVREAKREREGW